MTTAYLGLGANLGDRRATIERALDALAAAGVRVAARSPLYETDAVTPDPQPPYLNAAARIETDAARARAPRSAWTSSARSAASARPASPAAARVIDVDLLLYDDAVIDEPPDLVVPHPRLLERPFVRIPLADVAPPGPRPPGRPGTPPSTRAGRPTPPSEPASPGRGRGGAGSRRSSPPGPSRAAPRRPAREQLLRAPDVGLAPRRIVLRQRRLHDLRSSNRPACGSSRPARAPSSRAGCPRLTGRRRAGWPSGARSLRSRSVA